MLAGASQFGDPRQRGPPCYTVGGSPAGGQSITTVRQAVGAIDYTHHDQKKDRARHRLRRRPRTQSPSTPATRRSQACGAPASRRKDIARHRLRWHPRTQSLSTPATASRQPRGGWGVGRGLPTAASLGPHTTSQQQAQQKAKSSTKRLASERRSIGVGGQWPSVGRCPPTPAPPGALAGA